MSYLPRFSLIVSSAVMIGCAHSNRPASAPNGQDDNQWSDRDWLEPPNRVRPMTRWWWPGGNVTAAGITAELSLLDSLGFGGVEIQPLTVGLSRDQAAEPAVTTAGSARFVASVDHALAGARRRGLQVDLTMGSGMGIGGDLDCAECATHQLLMSELDVAGPAEIDVALRRPASAPYEDNPLARVTGYLGEFDPQLQLVAVLRGRLRRGADSTARPLIVEELIDITTDAREERLRTRVPAGRFRIFAVFRNLTNTRLSGAAYPGDPASFRTVDHLDARGLSAFRRTYFDSFTQALRVPPDHFFVDSFEFLTDLPWTPSFDSAFSDAKGYALTRFLPLLFLQSGEFAFAAPTAPRVVLDGVGERVREDYVDVRARLFETEFIAPLGQAVSAAGARLRLQALGGYGDYLDVFGAVDVPEAEHLGLAGRADFLRLASSAAHVAGRRRASIEAFVGRASSGTALTEDDYHRLAGRAFAAGINQLVYHGRAYPTASDPAARWYPFSGRRISYTTRLDETNAVWPRLPHLNATFGRLAYAMTRGRAVAHVAWLVTDLRPPEFDMVDRSEGSTPSNQDPYGPTSAVSRVLRQHAVAFDRVSRRWLTSSSRLCDGRVCIGEGTYDLLLVDHGAVADVDWLDRLRELARAGVPVVFVGPEAVRARGFYEAVARDDRVRKLMAELAQSPSYRHVANATELAAILPALIGTRAIRPLDPTTWVFATSERRLPAEDVILVFNGTDSAAVADFNVQHVRMIVILDPENPRAQRREPGEASSLRIVIPAMRSRVLRLLR